MIDNPQDKTPVIPDSSTGNPEDQPKDRSAEGRINELLSKNRELEEKLGELEVKVNERPVPIPPVEPKVPVQPDVKQAIEYLKNTGKFVDEADLDKKVKAIQDRLVLDGEHSRLEGIYDGGNGKPSYDRKKVEKFMGEKGIYDPEAAYKMLNEDELLDWEIKKAEQDRKKKPYVAKPGTEVTPREDNVITREKVGEWLEGGPEGRAQYEAHRKEILELMAKGQL